jgi:hypothetical protein
MKICLLKDSFGILYESVASQPFISLICLDLHQQAFQKLHTVKHSSQLIDIFVNEADPTTFLLKDYDRKSSQNRGEKDCFWRNN